MITFTLINNFDHYRQYKYGLNFEIKNETINFITSSSSYTYKSLLNTIISPHKNVRGQINFGKYEILSLDYKMRTRFLFDQLQIYNNDIFYDENITIKDFFKENWMLNHLNTKEFDTFFDSFIKEIGFERIKNWQIKNLSKEQKDMVGFSLAIFNKKKYLIINKELSTRIIYNHELIVDFLKKIVKKDITILWFSKEILATYQEFRIIDIDQPKYDCLNKKFILNDEVFLASKFCLTVPKWFKMTSILSKKMNIILGLVYGFIAVAIFAAALFFANKPITLFNNSIGAINDDEISLLIAIVLLITLLVLLFLFSFGLYRRSKGYIRFLMFNGVPLSMINFLICFIILIFGCSVIFSSYIILLITYSSFGLLDSVKWISSIYFPIGFLFFDIGCCIICANMIKNNLLDTKISKTKTLLKNLSLKRTDYGKKI